MTEKKQEKQPEGGAATGLVGLAMVLATVILIASWFFNSPAPIDCAIQCAQGVSDAR